MPYIIAGKCDKGPGFIYRDFWFVNGKIERHEHCFLQPLADTDFRLLATRGELIEDLKRDLRTWADGPVRAVERFVDHIRSVHPECGGPAQMACVSRTGSRWIHRLEAAPKAIEPESHSSCHGVLTAPAISGGSISGTSLSITTSTCIIAVNATNAGLTATTTGGGNTYITSVTWAGIGMTINSAAAFALESTFLSFFTGSGTTTYGSNGVTINGNAGYTGTLAAAIAAGKSVAGGIILN